MSGGKIGWSVSNCALPRGLSQRGAMAASSLLSALGDDAIRDAVDKVEAQGDYTVEVSGAPFNDAYRYVGWLLTVPLLLIVLPS